MMAAWRWYSPPLHDRGCAGVHGPRLLPRFRSLWRETADSRIAGGLPHGRLHALPNEEELAVGLEERLHAVAHE